MFISGHSEDTTDYSEIPAGGSTARSEFTAATVLWNSVGQGSVEQI